MMKQILPILSLAALTAPCITASAGLKSSYPLTFSWSAQTASGSFGSVRDGGNSGDQLQCLITAGFLQLGDEWAECDATSGATGQIIRCLSSTPSIISAVKSMHSESYVSFMADSSQTQICQTMLVANGSHYLPIKP